MSPLSYICSPGSYFTRVLISQGDTSPRIKCFTDSMFPMLYVPSCHMFTHILCSIVYDVPRVLCSLLSYVPRVICYPGLISQGGMSPLIKCSTDSMFHESYVPRVLCNFPGCHVPRIQCSTDYMFPVTYVPPCSMFPRAPMFPCSMLPRVLISQGVMSPVSNVPLILCFPVFYVPSCSMFPRALCSPGPKFPG